MSSRLETEQLPGENEQEITVYMLNGFVIHWLPKGV
jgi:hypothetical protein